MKKDVYGIHERVILFDGVCNFCSFWVISLISFDKQGKYRFASLQSEAGTDLMNRFDIPQEPDSVILIEHNHAYTESTAVLRICRGLGGWWKWLYVFIIIPRPVRNTVYRWVAKHRYRLFGKRDTCMLPTPEMRKRFLNEKGP
jgi:predicted DCC family thiol-disulfide oxidoreductase YuxK